MSEDGDESPRIYTRPDGVTVEIEENGDRRFSGDGGGVLLIFRGTGGKWVASVGEGGSEGLAPLDALFFMRDRLLEVEDRNGRLLFPGGKLEVSSSAAWEEIFAQKGELQSLIEALLQRKPQFFRDIADRFNPGPQTAAKAEEIRRHRDTADEAVRCSIGTAARLAGDLPRFAVILEIYRNLREHVRDGSPLWKFAQQFTANETPSNFRKKLKRLGYGWLAAVKD